MPASLLQRTPPPQDLKRLAVSQLPRLAREVRAAILSAGAAGGARASAELEALELAIALHRVFDSPEDRLIWDVGDADFAEKIFYGRRFRFHHPHDFTKLGTPETADRPGEDFLSNIRTGSGLTSALGLVEARANLGQSHWVVAVVAEGALRAALASDPLSTLKVTGPRFLLVRYDHGHWTPRREDVPFADSGRAWNPDLDTGLCAKLGVKHLGPVDGSDIQRLVSMLRRARREEGPVLLQVVIPSTEPHRPATPRRHRPPRAAVRSPVVRRSKKLTPLTYTAIAQEELAEVASRDARVIAVAASPAMTLTLFSTKFPDRCAILPSVTEQALAWVGGLAVGGCRPVLFIPSPFLRHFHAQAVHDLCSQNLPVTFVVGSGDLGSEQNSHYPDLFDLAWLRPVPNLVVMAPRDEQDLRQMVALSVQSDGPAAIRLPRGRPRDAGRRMTARRVKVGQAEVLSEGH